MTKEEAKQFIGYNIKHGSYDPADFDLMTDEEFIEFAEYKMAKADLYANDSELES